MARRGIYPAAPKVHVCHFTENDEARRRARTAARRFVPIQWEQNSWREDVCVLLTFALLVVLIIYLVFSAAATTPVGDHFRAEEQSQLQLVEPEDIDDEEDLFEAIDKLIAQGINAGDVKKLQDAGIYTCNGLMMQTKKNLTGIELNELNELLNNGNVIFYKYGQYFVFPLT